ncbi:hypothetical protein [Clostridium tagluense]|uniref:HNH nuclease domain-containing protein n=1 Tax=Clostridium tagluense TaxID=360422 RepID=A0A401ULA2_9CLOT|nr:hypothetical protein [Clostridium tagluense]GCD10346.1 hypothetical protein Ctaglu_19690 [Clostridium tagluense]
MILINKKCFNNKIDSNIYGDGKIQYLAQWYQTTMMKQVLIKYNTQGTPSKGTGTSAKNLYITNKKYITDNIIPFFKKKDGDMDEGLVSSLLTGNFIGNLADLSEEPPSKDFSDYWFKIIGYYTLSKFVFYDIEKMKNDVMKLVEDNKFNEQECIYVIENIYNAKIKEYNSNHNKFKITPKILKIAYKKITKWNINSRKKFVKQSVIDIKKTMCIELQGKEKFYTNSSGDVNKLCDIEKFNDMIKFFFSYEMLNDKQRHIILNTLDIVVCPYCNRQYITSYEPSENKKDKIDVLATADLDHFYPKAKFQLFSLSLYNFVPACQICNSRMKIDKPIEILYPYAECFGDEVKFEVIPVDKKNEGKSLFDLLYGKDDTLKFEKYRISIDRSSISDKKKKKYVDGSIEMFQLEQVYQSHKEYAAEIIRTNAIYGSNVHDSVMNTLFNNEPLLNKDREESLSAILSHLGGGTKETLSENEKNRILYGINVEDKNQDLKKPLEKLTRDILKL